MCERGDNHAATTGWGGEDAYHPITPPVYPALPRPLPQARRFWEAATLSEFACDVIVDCGGHVLSPGFIDVQINGAYGRDFCDPRLTPADVQEVCARLLASGCTALCPTLVSSAPATYAACLATLSAFLLLPSE